MKYRFNRQINKKLQKNGETKKKNEGKAFTFLDLLFNETIFDFL